MRSPTVLLSADDDRRERLSQVLTASAPGPVVLASSATDLIGRVPAGGSIVVMDVNGPPAPSDIGGGVLEHLRALVRRGWRRVVLLDDPRAPIGVRTAIALGIRGYVLARPDAFPRGDAGQAPSRRTTAPEGLSAREVEVLQLVSRGLSNRQVGTSLGLSALTVKSHLARIGRKLGNGDRAAMVAAAFRAGLIT